MSEGKRPNLERLSKFSEGSQLSPNPLGGCARYALALEAALVKVTKALGAHRMACALERLPERSKAWAELCHASMAACELAAPLISNIPAPQKESR